MPLTTCYSSFIQHEIHFLFPGGLPRFCRGLSQESAIRPRPLAWFRNPVRSLRSQPRREGDMVAFRVTAIIAIFTSLMVFAAPVGARSSRVDPAASAGEAKPLQLTLRRARA